MCPRISEEEAKSYQTGSGGDWFSLKEDMEVARIQFLFDAVEDIPTFAVHKVKLGQVDRYVNCLREPGASIDDCPLCSAGLPVTVVRIIEMFDHNDEKVKIWERGKTFIAQLEGLINRYSPLSNMVFEIERHGKPKSQDTKYQIFPMDTVPAYDLAGVEVPELFGTLIIDASFEDQDYYLQTGAFPMDEAQAAPAIPTPARRVPATAPPARQAAPPARQAPVATPRPAPQAAPVVPRQAPVTSRAAQPPAAPATAPSRRTTSRATGTDKF